MNAWVTYKDADGKPRRYPTPCRRISELTKRVHYLSWKKRISRKDYATEITIRIERDPSPSSRVEAAIAAE